MKHEETKATRILEEKRDISRWLIFTGQYATAKLRRLSGCITIWDLVLAQAPNVEFLSRRVANPASLPWHQCPNNHWLRCYVLHAPSQYISQARDIAVNNHMHRLSLGTWARGMYSCGAQRLFSPSQQCTYIYLSHAGFCNGRAGKLLWWKEIHAHIYNISKQALSFSF